MILNYGKRKEIESRFGKNNVVLIVVCYNVKYLLKFVKVVIFFNLLESV